MLPATRTVPASAFWTMPKQKRSARGRVRVWTTALMSATFAFGPASDTVDVSTAGASVEGASLEVVTSVRLPSGTVLT